MLKPKNTPSEFGKVELTYNQDGTVNENALQNGALEKAPLSAEKFKNFTVANANVDTDLLSATNQFDPTTSSASYEAMVVPYLSTKKGFKGIQEDLTDIAETYIQAIEQIEGNIGSVSDVEKTAVLMAFTQLYVRQKKSKGEIKKSYLSNEYPKQSTQYFQELLKTAKVKNNGEDIIPFDFQRVALNTLNKNINHVYDITDQALTLFAATPLRIDTGIQSAVPGADQFETQSLGTVIAKIMRIDMDVGGGNFNLPDRVIKSAISEVDRMATILDLALDYIHHPMPEAYSQQNMPDTIALVDAQMIGEETLLKDLSEATDLSPAFLSKIAEENGWDFTTHSEDILNYAEQLEADLTKTYDTINTELDVKPTFNYQEYRAEQLAAQQNAVEIEKSTNYLFENGSLNNSPLLLQLAYQSSLPPSQQRLPAGASPQIAKKSLERLEQLANFGGDQTLQSYFENVSNGAQLEQIDPYDFALISSSQQGNYHSIRVSKDIRMLFHFDGQNFRDIHLSQHYQNRF